MQKASSDYTPHQLKLKLVKNRFKYIIEKCEILVGVVGHNRKKLNQSDLESIYRKDVQQASDA
jgi:hypothetical protein